MNLNNSNNDVTTMKANTTPPRSLGDYEKDKEELSREEFVAQYAEASGSKEDAEMLANEVYGEA